MLFKIATTTLVILLGTMKSSLLAMVVIVALGLVLMSISVIGIDKIKKQVGKMDVDKLVPDNIKVKVLKCLKLTIIGGTMLLFQC